MYKVRMEGIHVNSDSIRNRNDIGLMGTPASDGRYDTTQQKTKQEERKERTQMKGMEQRKKEQKTKRKKQTK